MQEGNKIKFETLGIERATSDNNCSLGGCNEIIGMIYRDGSLMPYESVDTNIVTYLEPTDPINTQFVGMWVHKTTKQNNYIALQKLNTGLRMLWKKESDMLNTSVSWTEIARNIPITIKKIDFVGNMIVVNSVVYLFKNGSYSTGFDVNNIPFRMNLGAQGNGVAVMYDGISFSEPNSTKDYSKTFKADKAYDQINADFKFLESEVKRGEYISGACFLRYAIKLYDGSYVGVSKPVLVTPDTYYKNIVGEKYDENRDAERFSYDSNPIKFALKSSYELTEVCDGLRLNPQLGLIQSLFGSTLFWSWIQLYDKGEYISTIQSIFNDINNAMNSNGIITDTLDGNTYNILNLYLRRKRRHLYNPGYDYFQPLDLDYWLLSKGKVGFREIFQFNSGRFDKEKYYKLDHSSNPGYYLEYFDWYDESVYNNPRIRDYERCKGWTWGAIPYFVPRLYETKSKQNNIFDDSNAAMIIAATLNPYQIGHDKSLNDATAATLLSWMKESISRDPWSGLAPIVTADGLDATASWFTTRFKDGISSSIISGCEDMYVPYNENACDNHGIFSDSKGAVFAPLNEHIGELGFGVYNKSNFEGGNAVSGTNGNNVSMVFGRELYTPVYEILDAVNIPAGLVSSIDIFMTPPVSMHEDYQVDSMRYDTMAAHRPYRKQNDVIRDLHKTLGQFHKIHTIPIEEIVTQEPGEPSILEHNLGKVMMPYIERGSISSLEQQPLLEWNGDTKNEYEVSYVYNNRLHIAQITEKYNEELYDDCNDELSRNNNARSAGSNFEPYDFVTQSQIDAAGRINGCVLYGANYKSNVLSALARSGQSISFTDIPDIEMVYLLDIDIDNVATTFVMRKKVTLNREHPQNTGFFYPNSGAKKVTLLGFVATKNTTPATKYFYEIPNVTFRLEQDKANMISYNFDFNIYDYLECAKIATYNVLTNESVFPYKEYEGNGSFKRDTNIFKVSEVNQPLVFPYASTYRVGYGKIIAFSSYTTALSQGQFGEYPLLVFTTEGIFAMKVDTSGIGSYISNAPLSREVCTNPHTIVQVDGGIFFGTAKGLMFISGDSVKKWSEMVNGQPKNLPHNTAVAIGDGLVVYNNAIRNNALVNLYYSISIEDFVEYINICDGTIGGQQVHGTRISYLYELHKLLVYNRHKSYSYLIDIDAEGKCTKLGKTYYYDNGNYPECLVSDGITLRQFTLNGDLTQNVDCLIQTRPILLNTDERKSNYRVVLRGLFNHAAISQSGGRAGIYVLGSLDGVNWMYIGGSEYLQETLPVIRDIGTTIERLSVKYIMAIYVSKNKCDGTKIDNLEISSFEKYNDKTR